jgi:hypothetical protein
MQQWKNKDNVSSEEIVQRCEECKSVFVYLMENRQARKISSVGIIAWKDQKRKIHFGVSDTGHWRSRGSNSRKECQNGKMSNARIR